MATVWIVLVGDVDEAGATFDAYVQHVFGTSELADDYTRRVQAAFEQSARDAPERAVAVWTERHEVVVDRIDAANDKLLVDLEEAV